MKRNIIKKLAAIGPPVFALLIVCSFNLHAQFKTNLNQKLEAIAQPQSTPEWVDFNEGTAINPETIFSDYKEAFNLTVDDNMMLTKSEKDEIGFTHYRYQQYYKNIKVAFGEFIVHQQPDGFVKSANGRLITGLNLNNIPSLNEQQALTAALQFMNAKKYLWQNAEMENELKRHDNNPSATYYPKGELMFAPANTRGAYKPEDYKLAWNFKIYTDDTAVAAKSVFVDAITGAIINRADISMSCYGATGTSAYNGSVSFNTQYSSSLYYSHDDCQTTDIYVYNCNGGGAANNLYADYDNVWTATSQQSAVQAQWGARMVYNYYLGEHGRYSWNGSSGDMIVYNNAYAGSNNACWGCTGNSTIYYAGNTSASTDDWNTNDIMGHEFTHGVTQASAGLVYSYESGALNESFSDIFGEMVESWSEGNCDFLVGGDRGAIRSFISPNSYSDPDTYLGTYWYTGSGDNGGVHTNSGVQNHWFYLLSNGGSGTTDFGVAYNVTGISRFKARQIAYRALTYYLTSSSQYIDARAASLHAAWDLYGQCSQEIISTGDAWHAVGVESQSSQFVKNLCGTYSTGSFVQAISQINAGNGCTTSITSPTNIVYFTARDRVRLYPGFRAYSGSRFIAYLEPCSSTMWKGSQDVNMSDAEKGLKSGNESSSLNNTSADNALNINIAPNPFTNQVNVSFVLNDDAEVTIRLFDALGNLVQNFDNAKAEAGLQNFSYSTTELKSGIYFMDIAVNGKSNMKKIVKM